MSHSQGTGVDYYQVLQVSQNADYDTIKKQYQRLVLQHHPDKLTGGNGPQTHITFQKIQEAWETLKDAQLRAVYDHQLTNGLLAQPHPVNGELDLDDMGFDEGTGEYVHSCRCGGEYRVTEEDLMSGADTVQCTQCSLSVRVLFSVADET